MGEIMEFKFVFAVLAAVALSFAVVTIDYDNEDLFDETLSDKEYEDIFGIRDYSGVGYYDVVVVQVLDGKLRPVQNAKVTVTYQLNYVKGYVTTREFLTNINGNAVIPISNTEESDRLRKEDFTVNVEYASESTSERYYVHRHENVIQLQLRVYNAEIRVVDEGGRSLDASVIVGNYGDRTGADGYAFFRVPHGEQEIIVRYGAVEERTEVDVTDDFARTFTIPIDLLRMRVVDQYGNPLRAEVEVRGKRKATDAQGYVQFGKLENVNVEYYVEYQEKKKNGTVNAHAQDVFYVSFDKVAPKISNVSITSSEEGIGIVTVQVRDRGDYASGLGGGSLVLEYSVNGTDMGEIIMYRAGYNEYQAEIPEQASGSEIKYTVYAEDLEGNMNHISGTYTIEDEQVAEGFGFEFDWTWICVGLIIIVVAIFVYGYIKEQ